MKPRKMLLEKWPTEVGQRSALLYIVYVDLMIAFVMTQLANDELLCFSVNEFRFAKDLH